MGGVLLTFSAAYSDTLSFVRQIAAAAAANPVRAVLIAIGIVLIVSAFWEDILDAAGIQSNARLLTKINSWLHFTFGYSLIETTGQGNVFTVITEFQGKRFTITKDERLPTLSISSLIIIEDFKQLISNTVSDRDQRSLREDVVLEVNRLDLSRVEVTLSDGVFQTSITHRIVLTKDFDEFRLMEGINVVRRGVVATQQVFSRWLTKQLPPPANDNEFPRFSK